MYEDEMPLASEAFISSFPWQNGKAVVYCWWQNFRLLFFSISFHCTHNPRVLRFFVLFQFFLWHLAQPLKLFYIFVYVICLHYLTLTL